MSFTIFVESTFNKAATYVVGDAIVESVGEGIGNRLPPNKSQMGHIFEDRPGHFPDTPSNRKLLEDVSNSNSNYLGIDRHGNQVYSQMQSDGSQIWVYVRDGIIRNGGRNTGGAIRSWEEGIGLLPKAK